MIQKVNLGFAGVSHATNNLYHWSIGATLHVQSLRMLCIPSSKNHIRPLMNNSHSSMSPGDFAKMSLHFLSQNREAVMHPNAWNVTEKTMKNCTNQVYRSCDLCWEKHSLGSRGRHWRHESVRLNSFSLTRKYLPSGAKKSSGQSSHSSNTSSDFILSFSYSPHRLHFWSTSSVKGCK